MGRRLIVNADDYGRSPGVSRGILHAHREGIVTSTTVMINQPDIEAQLDEALACPELGIGLHLVFSAWRPMLPPDLIPGLVRSDGTFLDQHTLWAQADHIPQEQLTAELAAQMERYVSVAGRMPDHLDCHHFVHLYPPFFQVYADLAAQFGLPLRVPFPPESDFAMAVGTLPFLEGFPYDLVRGMMVTDSALLAERALAHTDHFLGTFFGRDALNLEHLLNIIEAIPDGICELMCHPGYDGPRLATSTYRLERETELALLTHPVLRLRVESLGIELVTFDVLRSDR